MRRHNLPVLSTPLSAIIVGTSGFGTTVRREEAFAILDDFAAAGGTCIDTAHVYAAWLPDGAGASERTVGAWLAARGMSRHMVVASKGGHPALTDMERSRLRPEDIAADLADSIDRLARPVIDLYWIHRDDERIPVAEILDALQPHLRQGTIRAIGASNWSWQRIAAANAYAAERGWSGFAASQISWSLASFAPDHRFGGGMVGMDDATMAWHARSGVPQVPYSAQANGFFAKPLELARQRLPQYDDPVNHRRWQIAQECAARHQVSANAIALAWLLQHPQGGYGIVGPKDRVQLADSLTAADLVLGSDEHAALTAGRPSAKTS